MGISLRKVVVILAILTIAMTGSTVYAYVLSEQTITEHPAKAGMYIKVYEIDYVPSEYYVLDEDPYMSASLENPHKWVWVGPDSLWKPWMGYVKVNGKYYGAASREVLSKPVIEPMLQDFILLLGFLGLGVCWIDIGYAYRRNRKRIKEKC